MSDMTRREFIALIGGAGLLLAAKVRRARAQQGDKTPRVGYIRAGTPNNDPFGEAFVRGMRDLGYVEGRNIAFEFRNYGDDVDSIASHQRSLAGKGRHHRGRRHGCRPGRAGGDAEHPYRHGSGGRSVGQRLDRKSGAAKRQHDRTYSPGRGIDHEAARTSQGGHAASRTDCCVARSLSG